MNGKNIKNVIILTEKFGKVIQLSKGYSSDEIVFGMLTSVIVGARLTGYSEEIIRSYIKTVFESYDLTQMNVKETANKVINEAMKDAQK